MNMRLGFSEQTVIYAYFSFVDIIGLVGGLWATFKSITANFGVLSVIWYVYSLAQMIRRNDVQRFRFIEIKQFLKHVDLIREAINEKLK
jgi:hypothetical protein